MNADQQLDQLDIFLSYANQDGLEFAHWLHEELSKASPRFEPWYDQKIRAEMQFDREIEYKLSTADVMIVVLTQAVPERDWCRKEIAFALKMSLDIMVAKMHDDVADQISLITLPPIDFAADREAGLARLVEQLETYATPGHSADKLGQETSTTDPAADRRHQAFARDVKERQREESVRAADPAGARRKAESRIAAGLRREREAERDVRTEATMRFINEIPVQAPIEFQDRQPKMRAIKKALNDPGVRMILLIGGGGTGKTSLIAEVRRRLAGRRLGFEAAGFVYLAVGGYRQVSAGTLLEDLSRLAPDDAVEVQLGRRLQEHIPTERKLDLVLAELGSTRVVVAIDDFDDLLDEAGGLRDRDLDVVIRKLVRRDDPGILLLLSTKREPVAWRRKHEPHVLPCELKEGLPHSATRNFLARLDEAGLLGVEAIPESEIRRLGVISNGIPRFIELVYCLLRSDPDLTLDKVMEDLRATSRTPEETTVVLFQRLVSRLTRTEHRVIQALAVYGLPVRPEAVDFLLQEYVPGVDSAPILGRLEERRLIRRDGDRCFLPSTPDAELILETVPTGSEDDFMSLSPLYTRRWLLHRAADYFHQASERADPTVTRVDDLLPQLTEIRLRIAADGHLQALTVMDDLDTKYLTKWGQSHVLTPMRRKLKDSPHLTPQQRAHNLSALLAARHGEEEPTGSDTATLAELMRQMGARSEPPGGRITLRIQMGNRLLDDGRLTEAIKHYRTAARYSRLRLLRHEEGKARMNLGISLARLGRFQQAERHLNRVQRLVSTLDSDGPAQTLALTLLNQAWLRGQLGEPDPAMELLDKGLEIARRVRSRRLEGQILDGQAALLCEKGAFDSAILLANESAQIGVLTNNPALERQANVSLAQAYLHAGKLEKAMTAVEAAVSQPSGIRALGAWVTYGVVLFRQGSTGEARAAFHTACTEAWLRIQREPREYQTHDAAGLALCGLALCGERDRIHRAVEAYHRARRLAPVDGARQNARTHLTLFGETADQVILAQARRAADGRTSRNRP